MPEAPWRGSLIKTGNVAFWFIGMPRKPRPLPAWDIFLACSTSAKFIGRVEAADAEAAIEAAVKEFEIAEAQAKRLIAARRA